MAVRFGLSRRGFLKGLGVSFSAVGAIGLLGYGYVFYVEPRWLVIEQVDLRLPALPPAFENYKIVCLSDFHFGAGSSLEYVEQIVRRVNLLKPDLVCLLGDYVYTAAESISKLGPLLGDLVASDGVFAILGNHDLWTDAGIVRSGLEGQGIRVLVNEHVTIQSSNSAIILAGLDDGWSGRPDLELALTGIGLNAPVIVMLHEPDIADQTATDPRVRLQLSGHSHGGQVRLPFIGAPFLPQYAKKYDQGLYPVKDMWLYVTRGVGVIEPPGRFNCRPEITAIRLVSSQD